MLDLKWNYRLDVCIIRFNTATVELETISTDCRVFDISTVYQL